MKKYCVAMAYKRRPLYRVAVGATEKLIYVANPDVVDNGDDDEIGAVGFPKEFVFEADKEWLDELESAFDSRQEARLESLWQRGRPLVL